MDNAVEKIGKFLRFGSHLGLERIKKLLEILGNPQEDLKVIHVAGTNGKGSVCRYIYEILEAEGYKAGLYTSPYIECFNERIEYHGKLISDMDLEKCTNIVMEAVDTMIAEGFDSPTEFEVVTAVAVVYFKMNNPDFVILEVGLGGRGDSTNITNKPLVSVITSISYDHMDRLGNTLTEIAMDKAGIIKPGVPVISGVDEPEAAKVIAEEAYKKECVLHDATKYKPIIQSMNYEGSSFSVTIDETEYRDMFISMCGEHQVANATCALTAIELLRKSGIIKLDYCTLKKGLKKAQQKGRFEIFQRDKIYVLDGAHNQGGMEALVKAMDDCFYKKKILVIIGMLADKAIDDILDMAVYLGEDFMAVTPDNPRSLSGKKLAENLTNRGKNCIVAQNGKDALLKAKENSKEYDVILFAGSLYLIGEIRRLLSNE